MTAQLGIIEGYYGKPWSWQARAETVTFLKPHGYAFYLYAPKFFIRKIDRCWTGLPSTKCEP